MKADELMVGDYVYNHRNWECPIVEIHKNSAVVIAKHYGEEEFLLSDLRPIPLTPEILEKNGFTKELDADESHYWFTLIDENIRFSILYARGVFQWLGPLDFKYVHELQHALRLCGIEKEIIL